MTLAEIEERFCANDHRKKLFEGLCAVIENLRQAGCRVAYVDGSFVTGKPLPSDFDGCWDPVGVLAARLDPVLLDFENGRAAQKKKYGGEMFICTSPAVPSGNIRFLEFFQKEKHTGEAKGLIGLRLDGTI